MTKVQVPYNVKALSKCIADAGLTEHEDTEYVSIEHFIGKTKDVLDKAFASYYAGRSKDCENELNRAIEILEAATIFNQNFGL